jgi:DNA-directed RNA polymerase beta subunit
MVRDRDIAETIAYDIGPGADPINTRIHETVVRALRVTRVAAASGHDFAPIADELDPGAIARFLADRVLKASSHRRRQGPARRVTPANEAARAQAVADTRAEESRRIRADLLGVLDYNILPHLGRAEADRGAKLQYIGRMLHNMCLVHFDVRAPTDRDNLAGKRVHGPGLSFSKVFKTFFGKEIALPLRRWINRAIDGIRDPNSLTASAVAEGLQARLNGAQKFERTLADLFTSKEEIRTSSGPPVKKRFSAKALERKNQANVAELIRNVCASSANKANKQNERADFMRRVHASFAFFICILKSADTGEDVGIKKSLALMSTVTSADETALPVAAIAACAAEMAAAFAEYAAGGGGPDGDVPRWPYGPTWATLPEPAEPYGLAPIRLFSNASAAARGLSIARVDGEPVAWTDNHLALAAHLRAVRRAGTGGLGPKATVMHDPVTREVDVWVNAGRFVAPFLVVADNAKERQAARRRGDAPPPFRRGLLATPADMAALQAGAATLEDLRRRGVVEWLTPGEVATGALIAPGLEALREAGHDPAAPRYTHLGPAQGLLGLAGITSPYTGHTQPVRGTYQTNHGRAAGGWPTLVPEGTPGKHTFNMFFCEHPLVGTFANRLTRPNGINATVAYCVRGGASIEDGAVMSRGFQARGGFVGAWFDGVRVVADRAAGEEFGPPPAAITANPRSANYALLGPAGHVETGTFVEPGDVLVGLHAPAEAGRSGGAIRVDRSAVYKGSERALVEEAYRGHGAAGDPFVYVRLRKTRPAGRGNKYSSRQGNKAIVGMCVNDEDMPYDERGVSPDILINPHSVPSRMITGQMIEALTCLYCRATGTTADATAFLDTDVAAIQDAIMALAPVAALSDGEPLGRAGGPLDVAGAGSSGAGSSSALPAQLDEAAAEVYRRAAAVFESEAGLRHSGLTRLYDGRTGRHLDAAVFQSPTYYQLIQKFGVDNAYATSKAPTDALTGQPLSGKAARGGHRISELQAWVTAGQGAMAIMGETFYNRSDATITNVCRSCGGDGAYDTSLGLYRCISCGKKTALAGVDTCQTTNVFRKIVRSAGVDIRLHPRPLEFPEPVPDSMYE